MTLLIKAMLGVSLLDYPGVISSVIFTGGCNLRCPFCQNPDLVDPQRCARLPTLSPQAVMADLASRQGFVDGVVITGGEPTIQDDLSDFLRDVRRMGMVVKLDTNGIRPGLLATFLSEGLVDYVALDLKTSPECYPEAVGCDLDVSLVTRSVTLLKDGDVDYEFRTTCVPGVVDDEAIAALEPWLRGARRYALQQYRPAVTLDPSYGQLLPYPFSKLESWSELVSPWVDEVVVRA